jgi:hypothetical protein
LKRRFAGHAGRDDLVDGRAAGAAARIGAPRSTPLIDL